MMKRKRRAWLVALVAVMVIAGVGIGAYFSLRPPPAQRLAATLAESMPPAPPAPQSDPVPAPAPEPAASPATGPASSLAPPASSGSLEEKQFIEISATVLIRVAQIQDRPDAKDLIPAIMEKSLSEAGVGEEEFEALGQKVYADPARSQRVADAILKRVDERATPEMRMRVVDLAETMAQMQKAKPPQR